MSTTIANCDTRERRPVATTLVLFVIFVAAPVALGLGLSLVAIDQLQQRDEQRLNRLAEGRLDRLAIDRMHGLPFSGVVRRLQLELFSDMMVRAHLGHIRRELGSDTLFVLLEDRRVSVRDGPASIPTSLIVNTIRGMRMPGGASSNLARRLDPWLRATLGPHVSLRWLRRNNGAFVPIRTAGGLGLALFDTRADGQSIVLVAPTLAPSHGAALRQRRRSTHRLSAGLGVAIPALGVFEAPTSASVTAMRQALALVERSATDWTDVGDHRWFCQRDRYGRVLTLTVPLAALHQRQDQRQQTAFALAGLLAAFGFMVIRRTLTGAGVEQRSIRLQLWLLFAYIALLPLAAALLLGWSALRERTERLRSNDLRVCCERLQIIEGHYHQARQTMLAYCRRLRNDPEILSGNPTRINRRMDQARLDGFAECSFILGDNAATLHARVYNNQVGDLTRSLVRIIAKRFAPDRLSQEQHDVFDPMEVAFDDLAAGETMGVATLLQFRDQMRSIYLTRVGFDAWWDVYPERATGPIAIFLTREQGDLMSRYLDERRPALRGDFPMHYIDMRYVRIQPKLTGPLADALEDLMVLSWLGNRVLQREISRDGTTWWVACMPDGIFNRFGLVCHRRADDTLAALKPLRIALAAGLIVSILMAWLAGRFLADRFLTPLADLTAGVQAIHQRRSDHRVPRRRDDELGALATAFNRTLADLRELELARIVQTRLFPAILPQPTGYEIFAESRSATDLGGDYYDARLLPDGRLLYLIGDATGHGISAALAMAVARTAFSYAVAQPDLTLADVLATINRVFNIEMKPGRKYMTMALALLDPHSNTMTIHNAGHNPSILYHADTRTTETFMLPGLILGMRPKITAGTRVITLAAGDVHVFYTDGFTECPMGNGEFLDLAPFAGWVAEAAGTRASASEICRQLFARLERERQPGPLPDDVTLFVIRRLHSS